MTNFPKYKRYGKGWYGEPYRHSLARRGIKTRRIDYNAKEFIERQKLGIGKAFLKHPYMATATAGTVILVPWTLIRGRLPLASPAMVGIPIPRKAERLIKKIQELKTPVSPSELKIKQKELKYKVVDFSKEASFSDILDFEKSKRRKPVEKTAQRIFEFPQEKKVVVLEKPLNPLGIFSDLFRYGNHLQVINKHGDIVRDIKKKGNKVFIDPQMNGVDIAEFDVDDELLYEPWFMDYGSIVFVGNKSVPGFNGKLIKLGTENDKLIYVDNNNKKGLNYCSLGALQKRSLKRAKEVGTELKSIYSNTDLIGLYGVTLRPTGVPVLDYSKKDLKVKFNGKKKYNGTVEIDLDVIKKNHPLEVYLVSREDYGQLRRTGVKLPRLEDIDGDGVVNVRDRQPLNPKVK